MLLSPYWSGLLLNSHKYYRDWQHYGLSEPYYLEHDTPAVAAFSAEARRTIAPEFKWFPDDRHDALNEWIRDRLNEKMRTKFPKDFAHLAG